MLVKRAINHSAVNRTDTFLVVRKEKDKVVGVESHKTEFAALKARNILAEHDLRVGSIQSLSDYFVIRMNEVEWE